MENNKLLLVIAVVAGVFATGLAFTYIQSATTNNQPVIEQKEKVLRVNEDLDADHIIDPDRDLSVMEIPADTFAGFAKTLYKADEKESLRGQKLGMPVPAGTPLQYAHVKPIQDLNLAPGSRLFGITVKSESLMGGLLVPGDRVDIIATYHLPRESSKDAAAAPTIDPNNPGAALGAIFSKQFGNAGTAFPDEYKSAEILSNIRIVGIGSSLGSSRQQFLFTGSGGDAANGSVVTLEVTSEQAIQLIEASAASGNNITLLLRPAVKAPTNLGGPQSGAKQGG